MPPKPKSKSSTPLLPSTTRSGSSRPAATEQLDVSQTSTDGQNGLSEEGRVIFSMLMEKLDAIVDELKTKNERLDKVEQENVTLRTKISKMEERIDLLENRDRCNNLVLSGSALTSLTDGNLVHSTVDLLKQAIQYELNSDRITSAFRLGPRPASQVADGRKLMIRFRDKGDRDDVLFACKRRKPSNLYANEDLTPHRANILFALRHIKRKSNGKIVACGSLTGRVYAFLMPPNQSARPQRVYIDNMEKLNELCQRELGVPYDAISKVDSRRT